MSSIKILSLLACSLALAGCSSFDAADQPAARNHDIQVPGVQPDGGVLLPTQWFLRPVGRQFVVGDFPVNIALHPGGKFAAVLHSGNGQHEVIVIEIPSGRQVSRAGLEESFYGITFTKDGTKLFCSGAGRELVHAFAFKDGYLFDHEEIRLRDVKERGIL